MSRKITHLLWHPSYEVPREAGEYLVEWGEASRVATWDDRTGYWRDEEGCALAEGGLRWARLPSARDP